MNPSLRIALLCAVVGGGAYVGYQAYAALTVDNAKFDPVVADDISLVAIESGRGFRVIVANQMAQLADGGAREKSDEYDAESTGDLDNLKRLPIRELILAHSGDQKALSTLISRMNDLDKEDRLPTTRVMWRSEDVQKAIGGDATLRAKLERNLNVKLDGTPLAGLSVNAIENGIVVPVKVPVLFVANGQDRSMTAEVLQWFLPTFSQTVMNRYSSEADVTPERIAAYYLEEAKKVEKPQDVAKSLTQMITKPNQEWSERTGALLSATHVLMNSTYIKGLTVDERVTESGKKLLDLHLDVSDEGRRRMWQFSRKKDKFQLMLIVNGIAIAAPTVREELSGSTVTISNLPDEDFIRDAVSTIQERIKK